MFGKFRKGLALALVRCFGATDDNPADGPVAPRLAALLVVGV